MFEKNDRALLSARVIIMVIICIFAVASLAMGIALAVVYESGVYFLTAIAGWFLCWIMWVFAGLILSYLCDIKLIRNKLYGESNSNLKNFLNTTSERNDSPEMQKRRAEIQAELQHLQQLLSSGIITTEEYEKRKKELTEGR